MSDSHVSLLDVEPDLGQFLTDEDAAAARRVMLPLRVIPKGNVEIGPLLEGHGAFGALVIEGMLLRCMRVGEEAAIRLIGPGDTVSLQGAPRSMLLAEDGCTAVIDTHVALFGNELVVAMSRWPRLVAGLHVRLGEQADRTGIQLAICQLPRVADRVLALMWLLAEQWGHVTSSGVSLPLALTHETFGALVGARRSTVTLALGELVERGAISRQDRGWLLLEAIAQPEGHDVAFEIEVLGRRTSPWAEPLDHVAREVWSPAELLATVDRMRGEHAVRRHEVREQLAAARRVRERVARRREELTRQPARRRPAPSS